MAMAEIVLTPKGPVELTLEAEIINPGLFSGKAKEDIEKLLVWQGPAQLPLADFFDVDVRGAGTPENTVIIIQGDVPRVKHIGHGMKVGTIEIHGSSGMHTGAEMAGGCILVEKDSGSWSGMEMKGGLLQIKGNAGDHVGSAYRGSWRGMTGGKIEIGGNARSQLGGGMAGGEILVNGNVENFCGIRQGGGAIIIKGNAVRGLGAEMTVGTIVILGEVSQFTPGFVEAGAEANPKIGERQIEGNFTKYSGDYAISKNPKGILYYSEGI
jgi:formylmethanofuran dehydrogenase subunit C